MFLIYNSIKILNLNLKWAKFARNQIVLKKKYDRKWGKYELNIFEIEKIHKTFLEIFSEFVHASSRFSTLFNIIIIII